MFHLQHLSSAMISANTPLLDAVKAIDTGNIQAVLVVDEMGKLLGMATDGDVRRGLLRGATLQSLISEVMNTSPATLGEPASREQALAIMRRHSIRQVPVLASNGRMVGLHHIDLPGDATDDIDPPWVVIMAGGRGTRLHPLTETTPKPMLHVGGQPLLETIIRSLVDQGFKRIYLSVNYMAEAFKAHFGNGAFLGADIRYIEERDRMGTAGALGLLPDSPTQPILVMNGDLLTQVNFRNLLAFHAEHKAAATMCVRDYNVQIPYGVVDMNGPEVTAIAEKPTRTFFVNAGIYVIEPQLLSGIAKAEYLDMTTLLEKAMAEKKRVCSFPIHEYWLDIGKFDDLERAQAEFHRLFGS
jgi:dTDP-glucose pyrophosphorylase/predicted transcriptional regulator